MVGHHGVRAALLDRVSTMLLTYTPRSMDLSGSSCKQVGLAGYVRTCMHVSDRRHGNAFAEAHIIHIDALQWM